MEIEKLQNKKKVYLIRHGESIFNKHGGEEIDCGLTDLGITQSKMLEEKLRDIFFEYVLISPLKRAKSTFEFSNIKFKDQDICYLCREHKTDHCDFMENEEIIFESESEVVNRCRQFKSYLQNNINHSLIAVFCHADFIYYLMREVGKEGIWLDNAEFAILEL